MVRARMAHLAALGRAKRRAPDSSSLGGPGPEVAPGRYGGPGQLAGAGADVLARSGDALGVAGDIAGARQRPVPARLQALGAAVDRVRRRPQLDVRQILLVTGALAMGLGLVAIVLGWYGASHSAYLFQEIPYLISGGLLGVALVAGGGFLFFAAWIIRLIDEQRRFSSRVEQTLEQVDRALTAVVADAGRVAAPGYQPPPGPDAAESSPSRGAQWGAPNGSGTWTGGDTPRPTGPGTWTGGDTPAGQR